ncbi:MAG: hypothetical protein JRN52_07375 [Nitrososphaerota archaeon]|nr:hypothetical protein [Nitrososphaerota archaeon]
MTSPTKEEAQNTANEMLFQMLINVRKNHPGLYEEVIKATEWDTTDRHLFDCLSVLYADSEEDRLAINEQRSIALADLHE